MFDLHDFVDRCRRLVGSPHATRQILELMEGVVRDADAIKKAITPANPKEPITDAILFRSDELLVFNATLPPHVVSVPHDHRMWAVIGIYQGQENNVFYKRSATGLEEANRRNILAGEAIILGADVIHAVANPLDATTLGLHVYGGDLVAVKRSMWHPSSGEEHPYDARKFVEWSRELAKRSSAV